MSHVFIWPYSTIIHSYVANVLLLHLCLLVEWQQKGCYKRPRNKVFKRLSPFFRKKKIRSLLKKKDFAGIFHLCKTAAAKKKNGLDVSVIGIRVTSQTCD